jgi:hypothetical protein
MPLYVETNGVRFPHRPHWNLLSGMESPCSACHTHTSGESDLSVDESSCYLCHAMVPRAGAKVHSAFFAEGSCLECHGPRTHAALAGKVVPVDHGTVLERGIECTICHHSVLEGSGAVRDRVCRTCHGTPSAAARARDLEGGDTAEVHQQHYRGGREPACRRCHDGLQHRESAVASAVAPACGSCHAPEDPDLAAPVDSTVHRPQQLLYAGLVAEHQEMLPATKFAARVSCAACHSSESMHPVDSASGVRAMNAECVACHGPRFTGMLERWVLGMRDRTASVGRYVQSAVAEAGIRSSSSADSLAQAAERHWFMVKAGNGVHNIPRRPRRGSGQAWTRRLRRRWLQTPRRRAAPAATTESSTATQR